ncbi:unnamed protein product [Symbiodinium natans]|uniref:Retrovirus-related Pol polyprotein from transposon TNT 1-94 n=1 Tax=Symbiodinium natans TaxID=878477 RepID=A0A812QSV9_9DINO|nr:unnamed protein product [Symbiodinium natans]
MDPAQQAQPSGDEFEDPTTPAAPALDAQTQSLIMRDLAQALNRLATAQQGGGFKDGGKALKAPEVFGPKTLEEEINGYEEWAFQFLNWLIVHDPDYREDLQYAESTTEALEISSYSEEGKKRALKLYSILSSYLRGRPLRILKAVSSRDGFLVWQRLHRELRPSTRSRELALAEALVSFPGMQAGTSLLEYILVFEKLIKDYEAVSHSSYPDNLKISTLLKGLPQDIKRHIQMTLSESSTYTGLRDKLLQFEQTTASWTTEHVMKNLNLTSSTSSSFGMPPSSSFSSHHDTSAPMDVDRVENTKGGGKWHKGGKQHDKNNKGGKPHGKGWGFGKSNWVPWKGKGKDKGYKGKGKDKGGKKGHGHHGGRPYNNAKDKGKGKRGGRSGVGPCFKCGKMGHVSADCWSQGQVRQVEAHDSVSQVGTAVSTSATLPNSTSATATLASSSSRPAQAASFVRRLEDFSEERFRWSDELGEGDVAIYDMCEGSEVEPQDIAFHDEVESWDVRRIVLDDVGSDQSKDAICVVEEPELRSTSTMMFDMSKWDTEDELDTCESDLHVRMIEGENEADNSRVEPVIFDSGADVTVLPMDRYAHVGCSSDSEFRLRDAQGNRIPGSGTRARVRFEVKDIDGGTIVFEEDAVLAQVATPLLCTERIFKGGWSLLQGQAPGHMLLSKGSAKIPVHWQKHSLAMVMHIRKVDECHVRMVIDVGDELYSLVRSRVPGWSITTSGHPVCVASNVRHTEDPTLKYGWDDKYQFRTTLIQKQGREFEVFESGEYWDGREKKEIADFGKYTTLTLLTQHPVDPDYFGKVISNVVPSHVQALLDKDEREAREREQREAQEANDTEKGPVAPAPEVIVEDGREVVTLAGVEVEETSSLNTLRAACKFLGVSAHGSRSLLWSRVKETVSRSRLDAVTQISDAVLKEYERDPRAEPLAKAPSVEEQELHSLTHMPRQPWCQACLAARSKEDNHTESVDENRAVPVLALDYMHTGTEGDKDMRDPLAKHLVAVDMKTKYLLVIPIDAKGGSSLMSATEEITRMLSSLGYNEVHVRADTEPAMEQLVNQIVEVRAKMGLKTGREPVPPDSRVRQALPAERYIHTIRQLGMCLLESIKLKCGYRVLSDHPAFSWAFRHAAWLYTRYHVLPCGNTPFELVNGRVFSAKIAPYGCVVYAQCLPKSQAKGVAWTKGIYLGRSHQGAVNVIGTPAGIRLARSMRRSPTEYEPALLDSIRGVSWNWALGAIGLRVQRGRRQRMPILVEAAEEEQNGFPVSDPQTGSLPEHSGPTPDEEQKPSPEVSEGRDDLSVSLPGGHGSSASSSSVASGMVPEAEGIGEEGEVVEPIAKVPRKEGHERRVDFIRRVEPERYDPSEEIVIPDVGGDLDDWEDDAELQWDQEAEELETMLLGDYEAGPPDLSAEALSRLDEERDAFELNRLIAMGVLVEIPEGKELDENMTELSSKNVRDWRWRDNQWTRRSRLVAREFRSLAPDLQDLYSPASISSTTKVMTALAATSDQLEVYSLDVSDAYLAVPQRTPKYIIASNGRRYQILFNLPGQREGASGWYEHFRAILEGHGLKACPVAPAIFSLPKKIAINSHVDDGQVLATRGAMEDLKNHLEAAKLKIKIEGPCTLRGGQCRFLKRTYEGDGNRFVVHQEGKYIQKIVELLGLEKAAVKNTVWPNGLMASEEDMEPLDPADHQTFRSVVGIILYISPDRPEIQCASRKLSSAAVKPTRFDLKCLRHVCKYLKGTVDYAIEFPRTYPGTSFLEQNAGEKTSNLDATIYSTPSLLETVSDADWASGPDRRSTTGYVIYLNGLPIYGTSRRQHAIALSSMESELYALLAAVSEGLFLSAVIEFITGLQPEHRHYTDASAVIGFCKKQGVGRARHVAVAALWVQRELKSGRFTLHKVSGRVNPADLLTKQFTAQKMKQLLYQFNMVDSRTSSLRIGDQEHRQEIVRRVVFGQGTIKAFRAALMASLVQQTMGSGPETNFTAKVTHGRIFFYVAMAVVFIMVMFGYFAYQYNETFDTKQFSETYDIKQFSEIFNTKQFSETYDIITQLSEIYDTEQFNEFESVKEVVMVMAIALLHHYKFTCMILIGQTLVKPVKGQPREGDVVVDMVLIAVTMVKQWMDGDYHQCFSDSVILASLDAQDLASAASTCTPTTHTTNDELKEKLWTWMEENVVPVLECQTHVTRITGTQHGHGYVRALNGSKIADLVLFLDLVSLATLAAAQRQLA